VAKFVFSHSKLRKQPCFAKVFKIQGGQAPPCSPFRRPCMLLLLGILNFVSMKNLVLNSNRWRLWAAYLLLPKTYTCISLPRRNTLPSLSQVQYRHGRPQGGGNGHLLSREIGTKKKNIWKT